MTTDDLKKARYINTLREFGPDMFNILYGIVAVTGWSIDPQESFSPQGLVDLNNNLMRFHAIADQVISEHSNRYPDGLFPNLDDRTVEWLERQKELKARGVA